MIKDNNCKKESIVIIKEVVDKNTNEKYVYPPVKYDGFERIYVFHENIGDKLIIRYYDIKDLHKLKKKNIKLLDHADRISEKDYNFLWSLANLDKELSHCFYEATFSKEKELLKNIKSRQEAKKSYKIF